MSIKITDPDMFALFLSDIKTRTDEENAKFVYLQWVLVHELKSNINHLEEIRNLKNKHIATLEAKLGAGEPQL